MEVKDIIAFFDKVFAAVMCTGITLSVIKWFYQRLTTNNNQENTIEADLQITKN